MKYVFVCLRISEIAQKVAMAFDSSLYEIPLVKFADGEINVRIEDTSLFKNQTVIIVQSTQHPVNDYVLGIAFLAQELKNAQAAHVIAVIPYFGYSRQERSLIPGKAGHARIIAALYEAAGIDQLLTVEMHDTKILEFFSIPLYNVSTHTFITHHIQDHLRASMPVCLVAPDQGARSYVENIAHALGVDMLIFSKERYGVDQTRIINTVGHCTSIVGIIIDDIIATGGTVMNVARILRKKGCEKIYGYFIHPIFAGDSIDRLKENHFTMIYIGNTLPLPAAIKDDSLVQQIDISHLIITALQTMIG